MGDDRGRTVERDSRRWSAQMRRVLGEIEEQRDDAVAYLSAIKLVLDVVARGQGSRQCAQEIAEVLLRELAVEACGVALREDRHGSLVLAGFATQAVLPGGPSSDDVGEAGWLTLAQLVGAGMEPTCFRRSDDGGFQAVAPGALVGDGFLVLPFLLGGEAGGALVLHSLVAPAQLFARGRALALVAEIVGQALTVAATRESVHRLCADLEDELGVTRRVLSVQQESLRSHEENIQTLTGALIRSNRVKREFLGTVSHELRTPLNAILGYASLVREGLAGPIDPEQAELLDRVLTNTRSLNALIDDILFFVQLESDRVLVQPETIPTAELIEETFATLPETVAQEPVPLRVEIEPDATRLHVDVAIARRLLFHLLSNAFKFTTAGEVRVAVRTGNEAGGVVLTIRDTGVGIPPERIRDMFELFSQGDSSTTRRYAGLGMGLTLVQRCVRLLGGEITVESTPGKGTEFRVSLPKVLAEPTADAVPERVGTLH
jgi:signal transduction histidine kinase